MFKKTILLDVSDNVATTMSDVSNGEQLDVVDTHRDIILSIKTFENLAFGHKIALRDLRPGDKIIKYGEVIGIASKPIKVGEWVHTHNVNSAKFFLPGVELRG